MQQQSQKVHQSSIAVVVLVAVVALLLSSFAITFPFPKLHSWESSAAHSEEEAVAAAARISSSSSMPTTEVEEIHGVKIERRPPQSRLDELGVFTWPTWSSGPSKIPWTFNSRETIYFLEGKVKVKVKVKIEPGNSNEEDEDEEGTTGWFEIGKGDLAVFPKGTNIIWNMVESVNKHFLLHNDDGNDNRRHKD